jgi:hypothetical protein
MGKKIFAILLILTIAISASACGKKKKSDDKSVQSGSNKQAAEQINNEKEEVDETSQATETNEAETAEDKTQQDVGSSGGIYRNSGEELSDFYDAFDNAMDKYEKAINSYETDDFELFDVSFDFLVPSACILNIGSYDHLDIFGTDEGEYREASGGVIKFGEEFTREEDGFNPNDKKGDIVREEGKLDTSTNTLTLEKTVERSGELISREVTEMIMLSDGTFISQILSKKPPRDERVEDKGNAYFVRCGRDKLEIIKADFEPDVDFTYESIVGKGDISPEDMSQGYVKVRKLTIQDDEAIAEKY